MKAGLNYTTGYKATIENDDGDDNIRLDIKKTETGPIMTIKQGGDIIALNKDDILALQKYLNQVVYTLN